MSSAYLYSPLDSARGEIRLVILEPGQWDDNIKFTLEHVSLSDEVPPMYETISYAWGDQTKRATVYVDGVAMDLPASSAEALRGMRRLENKRRLWIDAICIDQENLPERSAQVNFMETIYQRTQSNLIYLPLEEDVARPALQTIDALCLQMDRELPEHTQHFERYLVGGLQPNIPHPDDVELATLEPLFSLSWFRRLWVLQEAMFAPQDRNRCICGSLAPTPLLDILCAYAWADAGAVLGEEFGRNFASILPLYRALDKQLPSNVRYASDVQFPLQMAQDRECSDPRDKVFAVAGLLKQRCRHVSQASKALIKADYNKPVPEVLRDATRFALIARDDLGALELVRHRVESDFDGAAFTSWAIRLDIPWNEEKDTRLFDCQDFNAANRRTFALSPVNWEKSTPAILSLYGGPVDHAIWVSEVFVYDLWDKSAEEIVNAMLLVARTIGVPIETATGDTEIPRVAGVDFALGADSPEDTVRRYFRTLMGGCGPNNASATDSDVEECSMRVLDSTKWPDVMLRDPSWVKMYFACCNRRFFITREGRMGLGPQVLKVGDAITALYGGKLVYAARELDGPHRAFYLGEAYLEGRMTGKWMEEHVASGAEDVLWNFV